jgi:hypothetical protein
MFARAVYRFADHGDRLPCTAQLQPVRLQAGVPIHDSCVLLHDTQIFLTDTDIIFLDR